MDADAVAGNGKCKHSLMTSEKTAKSGMLLRTQIAIIVSAVLVTISIILIGFAELKVSWLEERYEQTLRDGDARALETLAQIDGRFLERTNRDLRELLSTRLAATERTTAGEQNFTQDVLSVVRLQDPAPTVTLMDTDFEPLITVGSLLPGNSAISLRQILTGKQRTVAGLLDIPEVGLANIFVSEVRSRDEVAGYLMTLLDFEDRASEFARDGAAVLFSGPGAPTVALAGQVPRQFQRSVVCCVDVPRTVRWREGTTHYISSVIPLVDAGNRPVGNLVVARDVSDDRNRQLLTSALSYGGVAVFIVLSATFLVWSLRTAFRPLNAMVGVLQHLARGDTGISMKPIRTNREISRLAETVESFRIGQKARLDLVSVSEQIANASRIQQSILPTAFDLDPRLDAFAVMKPAQDIGGDFFDLFMIDEDTVCVIVADVSGKGIGAALFASSASALLRTHTRKDRPPAKTLRRVNRELCDRNEEGLFLTVFLAQISLDTGEILYSNAGHPPPMLVGAKGVRDLPPPMGDTAIGFFEELSYQTYKYTIEADDYLLVYSDGLNEAMTPSGVILGDDGARRFVERASHSDTASDMVNDIAGAISRYSGSDAGADDLTLIAVRRQAGERPHNTEATTDIRDEITVMDDVS